MNNDQLQELLEFIKQHRSNEIHFEKLFARLEEESAKPGSSQQYSQSLNEIKEKQAEEYRQHKNAGTTAWPEFEKFVSEFEKTITEEMSNKS